MGSSFYRKSERHGERSKEVARAGEMSHGSPMRQSVRSSGVLLVVAGMEICVDCARVVCAASGENGTGLMRKCRAQPWPSVQSLRIILCVGAFICIYVIYIQLIPLVKFIVAITFNVCAYARTSQASGSVSRLL